MNGDREKIKKVKVIQIGGQQPSGSDVEGRGKEMLLVDGGRGGEE